MAASKTLTTLKAELERIKELVNDLERQVEEQVKSANKDK